MKEFQGRGSRRGFLALAGVAGVGVVAARMTHAANPKKGKSAGCPTYNVLDFGAEGDGTTDDAGALQEAAAAAAVDGGDICIPAGTLEGTYRVASQVAFEENVGVVFETGARISIDPGIVVSIAGPLKAGAHRIFSGPGDVEIAADSAPAILPEWWGAATTDRVDSSEALQISIDKAVENKAVVQLQAGQYEVRSTLVIPRSTGGFTMRGQGRQLTRIVAAASLGPDEPVLEWDASQQSNIEHHLVCDMTLSRRSAGPVIRSLEAPEDVGRWKGTIRDVRVTSTASEGTSIVIERGLKGILENVWLKGGELGLQLMRSSQMRVTNLYSEVKPGASLVEAVLGGRHYFEDCRCEGGRGVFAYHFDRTNLCTVVNAASEGASEQNVFLVEDCEGLVFVNPGVAFPDDGNHPRRGMYFVNSRNCSVLGGGGANFRQQGGAAGDDYTIEIDADSYGIRIDGLRIPSSNAIDAVKDVGAASSIRIFSNALQEFEEAGLRRVAVGPALPPGDLGPVVALREVFDENGNRLGVLPIYELAEP